MTPSRPSPGSFRSPVLESAAPVPQPERSARPGHANKPKSTGGKSKLILFLLLCLILVAGGAAGIYFVATEIGSQTAAKPVPNQKKPASAKALDADYTRSGWQTDAMNVLEKYLAATTPAEKLPYILNSEALAPRLDAFYSEVDADESAPPADAYAFQKLPEEDQNRGLFLMIHHPPPKVVAFFKHTAEGLKLDWEIFTQTKYRTLKTFIDSPTPGGSSVFRVIIMEDVTDKESAAPEIRTYRLADPIHTSDTLRVNVPTDSDAGRELASFNRQESAEDAPETRTATVELEWIKTDAADPEPGIRKFICWEFLGLGGEAEADTDSTR